MPGVTLSVSDFVRETREDINSPTTSTFIHRVPQAKETVAKLEEVRTNFNYFGLDLIDKTQFDNFQYLKIILETFY